MSDWIRVTRPPDSEREILLYVPAWEKRENVEAIVLGRYIKSLNEFRPNGSSGWEKEVTHWMPKPNPPRKIK